MLGTFPLQLRSTIAPRPRRVLTRFRQSDGRRNCPRAMATKRSPLCSVRESVLTRVIIELRRYRSASRRRSRQIRVRVIGPAGISFHTSKFHRMIFEGATRDLNVVERDGVISKFLVGLVAFARDQDDIVRLRQGNGA